MQLAQKGITLLVDKVHEQEKHDVTAVSHNHSYISSSNRNVASAIPLLLMQGWLREM